MATPISQQADEARWYFARERRRTLQNLSDFKSAGFGPAPFRILALAVNAGGAGYQAGDQFAVVGGTFSVQGTGYVVAELAGAATVVAVSIPGAYSVSPGPGSATSAISGIGLGLTVDPTMSGPFDFGAVAVAGQSANGLILPADVDITLELDAATIVGQMGVVDVTTGETFVQAIAGQANGRVEINRVFREVHEIRVFRELAAPAGNLIVYFAGPKSQLTQIGQAVFT